MESNDVHLSVNIDGIPLFKSIGVQFWPILIKCGIRSSGESSIRSRYMFRSPHGSRHTVRSRHDGSHRSELLSPSYDRPRHGELSKDRNFIKALCNAVISIDLCIWFIISFLMLTKSVEKFVFWWFLNQTFCGADAVTDGRRTLPLDGKYWSIGSVRWQDTEQERET